MALGNYTVEMGSAVLVDSEYPNSQFSVSSAVQMKPTQHAVLTFEPPPEAYQFNVIERFSFYARAQVASEATSYYVYLSFFEFSEPVDVDNVTFKTEPSAVLGSDSKALEFWSRDYFQLAAGSATPAAGKRVLNFGLRTSSASSLIVDLDPNSSSRPYVYVRFSPDIVTLKFDSLEPAGGFVDRGSDNLFRWATSPTGICAADVVITSSTVDWRIGETGSVSSLSGEGLNSILIPKNTFPKADNVQWRVSAALNTGFTITSAWQTISTQETLSTAECLSPKNVYLDATQPAEFSWRHIISTGTAQTAWAIQTSLDGSQWTDLANGTGAETSTMVAANTFEAGTLYWRVRTYNTDDTASEWSGPAQVTVIDAPDAPAVRVDRATPRAQISWQSTGQEGYEIELDGESLGVFFGTDTRYLFDDFLADGGHVVRVRSQSKYAYWSEWGSAGFTVVNVAGKAITLDGEGGSVATLTWSTDGEFVRYIVYRDGVPIGKTTATSWTDNLMAGDATYYVRGIAAEDGNYTQSNNANLQYFATANRIAAVEDWGWVELSLSTTDTPTTSITTARQFASTNYTGHKYPVPEMSEFYSKSISVSTAFPLGSAEAKAFEGLIGRVVCYKSISGDSVVGVLGNISKARNPFYVAYTCTISQIDWEEAVNVDP